MKWFSLELSPCKMLMESDELIHTDYNLVFCSLSLFTKCKATVFIIKQVQASNDKQILLIFPEIVKVLLIFLNQDERVSNVCFLHLSVHSLESIDIIIIKRQAVKVGLYSILTYDNITTFRIPWWCFQPIENTFYCYYKSKLVDNSENVLPIGTNKADVKQYILMK